jgi:hypothetical protein
MADRSVSPPVATTNSTPMREALLLLIAAGTVAGLWNWSVSGRDRALRAVHQLCKDLSLQALDETVVLRRVRLARDERGQRRVLRIYRFEFTRDGSVRETGDLALAGLSPWWALLHHPEGNLHIDLRAARGKVLSFPA